MKNKRELILQREIEDFLSEKLDPFESGNIRLFKRVFEPFLDSISNSGIHYYCLDGLSDNQILIFQSYYSGWSGGGGNFGYSKLYTIHYRGVFDSQIFIRYVS
jgi:hypothetical protein